MRKRSYLLERYPSVDLVHLDSEVIRYSLDLRGGTCGQSGARTIDDGRTYDEVLPHALELVADVVVVPLLPPFLLEEVERLFQDLEWSDGVGIGKLLRRKSSEEVTQRRSRGLTEVSRR